MQTLELLAPARNLECGKAAIDHGADAVYIGAQRFGARAAAGNSVEDIAQLCDYAHRFGARVYVTVNTIVYDGELEATQQLIHQLETARVDAVLVQDMAVAQMVGATKMELHASTQTDNRTVEKVKWLRDTGFDRTVLARELSLTEIAAIHKTVPDMDLEVFVHGALCVSYSGLCYASQYCFGRSANRGECAQFCRLKFDLVDDCGDVIEHDRHLLSLKDMNQIDNLEQLAEAGATSFKIEGRLKDSTYVKNVTAAYSNQLNHIVERHPDRYRRASRGHCTYPFEPNLHKTFNRGFTTYFAHGRRSDISSPDTPKAIGEYVGKVKEIRGRSFNVAGTASFANGDGLCFINERRELEGFRVNRVEGNRLFPLKMPEHLRPGLALYRNNDVEFERLLAKSEGGRKIDIQMALSPTPDGFALTISIPTGTTVITKVIAEHQEAQRPQKDNIIRQLTKLGNTIYECSEVELGKDFNFFIPSSVLTTLRRQAIEDLERESQSNHTNVRRCTDKLSMPPAYPHYSYLYNIANNEAKNFYNKHGLKNPQSAFELQPHPKGVIMQCRYCLRFALGYCVKNGGHKPIWKEPLHLCLPDGRQFRLDFDCRNCQMNILAD